MIESSVYNCLPYIPETNGLCSTTLAHSKWLYVCLKVNILYDIIFPEYFTIFHHDMWLCDNVTVTDV